MPFDYDQFLADVLTHVPDERKQAVEEALKGNDAAAKFIGDGFMRQSEFSRGMDEARKTREQVEADRSKFEAERQRYVDWYKQASKQFATQGTELERYREEFGDLEGVRDPGKQHQPQGLTEEQFNERLGRELEQRDQMAMEFANVLTDVKIDFRERFQEKLDVEALYKHQAETRLPLAKAYEDMIAPRLREAETAKHEEALKQAREEGRREALSQSPMPVTPGPSAHHAMKSLGLETPLSSDDRIAAAAADWAKNAQSLGAA